MTDAAPRRFGRRTVMPATPVRRMSEEPARVRSVEAGVSPPETKVAKPQRPVPALGAPGLPGTLFIVLTFTLVAVVFQSLLWFTVLHNTVEPPVWVTQGTDAWSGAQVPADPRQRGWVPPWLVLGLAGLIGAAIGGVLARSRYRRAISFLRTLLFCLAGNMAAWMVSSTVGMVAAMWWSPTGREPVKLLLSALMGPFGGVLGGLAALIGGALINVPMLLIGAAFVWFVTRSLDRSGKRAP